MGVLVEAAFHVGGDPCIEKVVRAQNNINLPVHHFSATRAASFANLLVDFLFLTATGSFFG
jgi:hypothetical protein